MYYQYYNGNPKPDLARSISKSFSDLPMELLDGILSNLSAKERFRSRAVSRNFRDVIDQHKPNFKSLKLLFELNDIILKIDDLDLKFPEDSYEESLKMLENTLKSSRHVEILELKLYILQGSTLVLKMLRNAFEGLLKVGKAEISAENTDEVLEILGFFEPGVLKEIVLVDAKIRTELESRDGKVENLFEMEQFQMAEDVDCLHFAVFDSELLKKFLHLKFFSVEVNVLTKDDALRLKNAFLELSGPRRWHVILKDDFDMQEYGEHLGTEEEPGDILKQLIEFESIYINEDIPNSEEKMQLQIYPEGITLLRNKPDDSSDA
ncbi:unnamed protein product [Caenorhabditis nigoni]